MEIVGNFFNEMLLVCQTIIGFFQNFLGIIFDNPLLLIFFIVCVFGCLMCAFGILEGDEYEE